MKRRLESCSKPGPTVGLNDSLAAQIMAKHNVETVFESDPTSQDRSPPAANFQADRMNPSAPSRTLI